MKVIIDILLYLLIGYLSICIIAVLFNFAIRWEEKALYFLVKYIRPLYAIPIGLIYELIDWILIKIKDELNKICIINIIMWNEIDTIEKLISYFKYVYKYKSDGFKGIFDHINFIIEFFIKGGDCDDAAYYASKKLNEIGRASNVYFIYGNGIQNWHFDCSYVDIDGQVYFFNYGDPIKWDGKTNQTYAKKYGWKKPCKWFIIK